MVIASRDTSCSASAAAACTGDGGCAATAAMWHEGNDSLLAAGEENTHASAGQGVRDKWRQHCKALIAAGKPANKNCERFGFGSQASRRGGGYNAGVGMRSHGRSVA